MPRNRRRSAYLAVPVRKLRAILLHVARPTPLYTQTSPNIPPERLLKFRVVGYSDDPSEPIVENVVNCTVAQAFRKLASTLLTIRDLYECEGSTVIEHHFPTAQESEYYYDITVNIFDATFNPPSPYTGKCMSYRITISDIAAEEVIDYAEE